MILQLLADRITSRTQISPGERFLLQAKQRNPLIHRPLIVILQLLADRITSRTAGNGTHKCATIPPPIIGVTFTSNIANLKTTGCVAIVSVTGVSTGAWQFLPNGGARTNFPTVSATSALLLSANDMIRYMPASTFVGTVTLKALAWDGSIGTDGKPGDPVTLGSSAFSTTTLTATASANRAPTLAKAAISAPQIRRRRGHRRQQPLDAVASEVRRSRW